MPWLLMEKTTAGLSRQPTCSDTFKRAISTHHTHIQSIPSDQVAAIRVEGIAFCPHSPIIILKKSLIALPFFFANI